MLVQLLKNEVRRDAEGRYCLNDMRDIASACYLPSGRLLTIREFMYTEDALKCKKAVVNARGGSVSEVSRNGVLLTYVHEILAVRYAQATSTPLYAAMLSIIVRRSSIPGDMYGARVFPTEVIKSVADVIINRPDVRRMTKGCMDTAIRHIRDSLDPTRVFISLEELSEKAGITTSHMDQALVEEDLQYWDWGGQTRWMTTPKGEHFARARFPGIDGEFGDRLEWLPEVLEQISGWVSTPVDSSVDDD